MDEAAQPRRRLGWWGWILIGTGIVGLVVVITAFWLRTTSDLDRQRRRAADLGLPMTWAALGMAGSPGDDNRIIAEAVHVAARGRAFDGPSGYAMSDPFAPVPPEASSWQLAGGSGIDVELDALIDRLSGDAGLWLDIPAIEAAIARRDAQALAAALVGQSDGRLEIWQLLRDRVMAGVDDPVLLAGRLERLAGSQTSLSLFAQSVSLYIAHTWAAQALRRREQLDPAFVAASARAIVGRLDATLPAIVASQPQIQDALLRLPPEPLFRALNMRLPEVMTYPFAMDFFHRIGRGRIVERRVTAADWCRRHGLPRSHDDILAAAPVLPREIPDLLPGLLGVTIDWGGCQRCVGMVDALHGLFALHLRITTQLRLIAADAVGEAWPTDPCDPRGSPLREIRRNGRMIGAYSLGANGMDDGGDLRADWCWPLREQLGPRKASDMPQVP
jgi:hypothetical protein